MACGGPHGSGDGGFQIPSSLRKKKKPVSKTRNKTDRRPAIKPRVVKQ